jgi:hypothetical protein
MGFLNDIFNTGGEFFGAPIKGFARGISERVESVPNVVKAPQLQGNPFTDRYREIAGQLLNQGQSLDANAGHGNQLQPRAQQQDFGDYLISQAKGQGPSVSGALLNQGLDHQLANNYALATSAKGNLNPALAHRMALQQNASASQNTAQQAAIARMQEMQAAQGLASQNLAATRQQDIQNSGLYGSLGLNYANLARQYENSGLVAAQSNQNAEAGANKLNTEIATGNVKQQNEMIGGAINGAGGAAMTAALAYKGGVVPGKANVDHDSPVNDTVPVMTSPGEIIIPNSHSKNSQKAKAFIDEIMSKRKPSSVRTGFSEVLQAQRMLNSKINALQKKLGKK